MDSGVETGNDSNDSSFIQHETITTTSTETFNQIQMNYNPDYNASETVFAVNENSQTESPSTAITLCETTNEVTLSDMLPSNKNIQNNALYGINTLALEPIFPLSLLPETKLEFRIPNLYSDEYPVRSPMNKIRRRYSGPIDRRKIKMDFQRGGFFYTSNLNERKLHIAARTNNIERMQELLDQGVSPNVTNSRGSTALHIASSSGYTEMVSLLLRYGADPNLLDSVGNTPLHVAVVSNHVSETLSNFCSRLTLSSTSDQPQDDIRNLLCNIDSLNLRN